MILSCLLNLLRLNADVSLRGGCRTVLKEPLHQRYVYAVCVVDFRCVPLAEAVGTDTLVPQVIAANVKLLLHRSLCDRKHKVVPADAIPQTVILHVLLNAQRNREDALLFCFLLHHFQPESVAIPTHISEPQLQNVTDTQAQVAFQHKGGCDTLIGAAAAEAFPHGLDDFFVLLRGQSLGFLVHGCPSNSVSSYLCAAFVRLRRVAGGTHWYSSLLVFVKSGLYELLTAILESTETALDIQFFGYH